MSKKTVEIYPKLTDEFLLSYGDNNVGAYQTGLSFTNSSVGKIDFHNKSSECYTYDAHPVYKSIRAIESDIPDTLEATPEFTPNIRR